MGIDKKYALLDTDFLYKSHLARNRDNQTLMDIIIRFEDYDFFCHEMIKEELTRREVRPNPNPWIEEKVKAGRIQIYSDRDIICELSKIYGESAIMMYLTLLETSCEIFNAGFFQKYYCSMLDLDNFENTEDFIHALKLCDDSIPHQNGLGEKRRMS